MIRATGAVAVRPRLWAAAARQVLRLGLPPDRHYLAFRATTQYGSPAVRPAAADVVSYLSWCTRMERLR